MVRRRREDEENNGKAGQQKQVRILHLDDARVCSGKHIFALIVTFGQEMEVRVVGERRTLNRLLIQISPEELLALDPV